jgi:hypothetical protein
MDSDGRSLDPAIRAGIAVARLAPSAHNTQPWRFRIEGGRAVLGWDPSRELPAGDPESRYLFTGLGAAAESFILGAAQAGTSAEALLASTRGYRHAASLTIGAAGPCADDVELAKAAHSRQTNRLPFRRAEVEAPLLQQLEEEAARRGLSVSIITGPVAMRRLGELTAEGTAANFTNRPVYMEFNRWLRVSRRDPGYDRDGLNLECLGLGRAVNAIAPYVTQPGRMAVLARLGLHRTISGRQGRLVARSPAAALLLARSHGPVDLFEGGQVMLRVWLRAMLLGLSVHPVTAAMDHPELRGELAATFGVASDSSMVVCFRLGYGPPAPKSARLPTDELLVS